MKTLFVLLLVMCFLNSYSQNDTTTINSPWKKTTVESGKVSQCKPKVFDTIYLFKTDTFIHVQLFGFTRYNYRYLNYEFELSKTNISTPIPVITNFPFFIDSTNNWGYITGYPIFVIPGFQSGKVMEYDTNSSVKYLAHLKDGYLQGRWEQYYPNGNIMFGGDFQNHARAGKWEYFYQNGKLMMEGNFYPNVFIFDLNHRSLKEKRFDIDIYGLNYQFIKTCNNQELNKFIKENIKLKGSLYLPCVYFYRDGIWMFYNQEGKIIRKKTYKKKAIEIDYEFDTLEVSNQ